MPLTPEEFLGFDAPACPVCGGEVRNLPADCAVQGGEVDETPGLLLEAQCAECHSSWTETFRLTGYRDLEPSEQGIAEIVPRNVRNAVVDGISKQEQQQPSTAQEWLFEIDDHIFRHGCALQGNDVPPARVETEVQFITDCLTAGAFLRKAGVNTQEVSAPALEERGSRAVPAYR